jgi:quercetin dioxygenase-like cupin family protein
MGERSNHHYQFQSKFINPFKNSYRGNNNHSGSSYVRGSSVMLKIQAIRKDALLEGSSSPGIIRHLAFKGEDVQVIRSCIDPGKVSGWHHHGDFHVYGYVVSGTIRLESGADVITISPGDFFLVPPHTVHREVNPSLTERVRSYFSSKGLDRWPSM